MNLPESFVHDMKQLLGAEFEHYISSYEKPRWYGLRVNTNKITVEEFLRIVPFEVTPIPWIENGFYYDGEVIKPAKHPYYAAGLYYLQEPSAMTPANRLPINPYDRVLDLCAAPGGKTTELGAKLKGTGILVSNDISNSRARILLKNQELFGLGNICVMSEDPEKLVPYFPEYFDKILIDAPCSGEGMFRKDVKMIKSWMEQSPEVYATIQKNLILQAAKMLKPGGMILFSTCTFNQLENEGTIHHLLEEDMRFETCPIAPYEGFTPGFPPLLDTVRIWPHKMQGEGHFLALIKKQGSCEANDIAKKRKNATKLPDCIIEFLSNVKKPLDIGRITITGDKVNYLPETFPEDTKGLRLLREGMLLGELKRNRFEPSQSLAMFLKKDEYKYIINFLSDDIRIIKYLKGETLDVDDILTNKDKGWFLVCVDGFPLGFAKAANQMLKNKYAPGWRWQSE